MRATEATEASARAVRIPGAGGSDTWSRRGFTLLVLLTALFLALVFGWQFLRDPHKLAVTIDPAWYTWRGKALLASDPSLLLHKRGPFGMLTGGYRVASPVFGSLMVRIAGVDAMRFTVLLVAGMPVLASLGVAAFAYRAKRDPLVWLFTAVAGAALFFTIPFIGYLDDITCLALLAVMLPFLEPARTSWGARSAVALLSFLALMTHPTTTAIFVLALVASTLLRWAFEHRFSVRRTLASDGPLAASVAVGLAVAAAWWKAGLWGARAPFGEAVLYQPYTSDFFRARLNSWVQSMHPAVTAPLVALAVAWIVLRYVRGRRDARDQHSRISVLWLLPYVGVLGFVLGKTYPYYRFLNPTLAVQLLVGIGLWVVVLAVTVVVARAGPGGAAAAATRARVARIGVACALLVVVGLLLYVPGLRAWNRQVSWIQPSTRAQVAAAGAYAAAMPERPIVFLMYPDPAGTRAWGVSKQGMNITLGALPADQPARSFFFVGTAEDFLAGRPTVTHHALFDRLSRNFLADARAGLRAFPQAPVVFALDAFDASAPPSAVSTSTVATGVSVIQGQGVAPLDGTAASAAGGAEARARADQTASPGAASAVWHLLRVGAGLFLLLVLPGLLATRWFGVRGAADAVALIPGLSFALSAAAGILVLSVSRSPMGGAAAWVTVALACGAGLALGMLARRRPALLGAARTEAA